MDQTKAALWVAREGHKINLAAVSDISLSKNKYQCRTRRMNKEEVRKDRERARRISWTTCPHYSFFGKVKTCNVIPIYLSRVSQLIVPWFIRL